MALTKLLYGPSEELSRIFPQNLFEMPFSAIYWGFTIRLTRRFFTRMVLTIFIPPHKIYRFCGNPAFDSNGQAKPVHFSVAPSAAASRRLRFVCSLRLAKVLLRKTLDAPFGADRRCQLPYWSFCFHS